MKRAALVLLFATLALTACSASPAPAPTTTVTTTVTATPAPVARSASDPLTKLDAWTACYAAVTHEYEQSSGSTVEWYPYSEKAVTVKGDGFEVVIGFPAGNGSGINTCTVSGPVGAPVLTLSGFIDI